MCHGGLAQRHEFFTFQPKRGHSAGYHPHAGDLPSLLAAQDGTAKLTVTTDALTPELLLGTDGASLIVHEGRDNFANIPECYAPEDSDQDTLKTGDAGARFACGVIEAKLLTGWPNRRAIMFG